MNRETVHKAISLELEKAYALPGAPSINAQESVDLLFQFLEYQPEENRLKQFSKGISDAFGQHDYEVLAKGIEPFIKVLLFLVDRQQYNELDAERNEHGHPVALPAWANAVGLTSHKKDSTKLNKFDLRRYFATLMDSRNEESHTAPDLDAVRKAHIVNAACVIYIWLINKYSDTIKLALLAEENHAYLERTVSTNKDIRATHVEIAVGVTLENSTDPLGGRGGFKMDLSSLAKKSSKQKDSQKSEDHEEEKPNVTTASLSYRSHPRSVLLGRPGGGKTTTLRLIALNESEVLLKGDYTQTFFPIYVRLNDFNRNAGIGIKELIQETFPQTAFEDLLKNRVILLLDGLNEVRSDEIADVIREVVDIQQQLVVGRMIVSTRPQAFLGDITGTHLEIQMLDDALMSDLVSKHMDGDSEKSEACLKFLKEDRKLTEWARNPLHLYMLAETYRTLEKPPENRGKLLEAFVRNIHKREALQGKHSCDINTLNTLLGHLAIDNIQTGNFHRPWHDVINVLKASAKGIGTSLDIPELIATLRDNNILRGQTDREVGFAHEMYQDYFAARLWSEDESLIDFRPGEEVPEWIEVLHIRNDLVNAPGNFPYLERLAKADCWAAFQAVYGRELDRHLNRPSALESAMRAHQPELENPPNERSRKLAQYCLAQHNQNTSEKEPDLSQARNLILTSTHSTYLASVDEWMRSGNDADREEAEKKVAQCLFIRLMLGDYQGVMRLLEEHLDENLATNANVEGAEMKEIAPWSNIFNEICEELSEPEPFIPQEFENLIDSLKKADRIKILSAIGKRGSFDLFSTLDLETYKLSWRIKEMQFAEKPSDVNYSYGLSLAYGPSNILPAGRDKDRGLSIFRDHISRFLDDDEAIAKVLTIGDKGFSMDLFHVYCALCTIYQENDLQGAGGKLIGEILDRCENVGLGFYVLPTRILFHGLRNEHDQCARHCKMYLDNDRTYFFFKKADTADRLARLIVDQEIDDDVKDVIELLRPYARDGDADCMEMLGRTLIWEVSEPDKNIPEGIRWLETAAKMGDVESMRFLYKIHCGEEDLGIKKTPEIGMGWLENAVKEGSSVAMLELGQKLKKSPETFSRAYSLICDASKRGEIQAEFEYFGINYNELYSRSEKYTSDEISRVFEKIIKGYSSVKDWKDLEKELSNDEISYFELAVNPLNRLKEKLCNHEADTWSVWQFAVAAERFRLEDPKVFNPAAARLHEEFRKLFPTEFKKLEERGPGSGQSDDDFDHEICQEDTDFNREKEYEIAYHLARNPDPAIGRNLFFRYIDESLLNGMGMTWVFFMDHPLTDWDKDEDEWRHWEIEWKPFAVETLEQAQRFRDLAYEALEYIEPVPKRDRDRRLFAHLIAEIYSGKKRFFPRDPKKRLEGYEKLLYCDDPPQISALRNLVATSGEDDGFPSDRSASQKYIATYMERAPDDLSGFLHKASLSLYYGDYPEVEKVADEIGNFTKIAPRKGLRKPPSIAPQYASDILKAYAQSKSDPTPANLPTPFHKTGSEREEELIVAPYLHAALLAKGLDKGFEGENGWTEADIMVSALYYSLGMHPVFFLNPDDADFHILSALLIRNNHDHKYGQSFREKVTPETLARHIDKAKGGGWEVPDWMYEIKIEEPDV